jgi:asparagine synthase (glutamine-hydrolysing)
MALANSVEARYPFLDPHVVDLATRIPPGLKLKNMIEKYIVKQVATAYLPAEIIDREKFGFRAPGSPYLLRENPEWVNDLLSYERIARQGYFNPDVIEKLKARYRQTGFKLNPHLQTDLLMIVLTFGILVDLFNLPERGVFPSR